MITRFFIFLILTMMISCNGKTHKQTHEYPDATLVLDTKSALGEGAIWNYKTGELYWVNITGGLLHVFNPSENLNQTFDMGEMIGTVVPYNNNDFVVALERGIYRLNREDTTRVLLAEPEKNKPDNRFNDGKCDPAGRLWVGTMSKKGGKKNAGLFKVEPDGSSQQVLDSITISNGIVWTSDRKRMYYIDTPTSSVYGFDYEPETGTISGKDIVIMIPREMGFPDGMTIDEEDKLWIAHWGGYGVYRWDPETGEYLGMINVPAKNVTSCAFGGDNLDTLYITTARQGTNDEELEKFPLSGGLFKVVPGIKGVKANFFGEINY